MKTAGIIAEYNPFHNGHQYQMETVRHLTGADFVIVAMSGDFMQRGVPAIADKYTRTRMALLGGADLVLELPAVWATASAEYFAPTRRKTWKRQDYHYKGNPQLFHRTGQRLWKLPAQYLQVQKSMQEEKSMWYK